MNKRTKKTVFIDLAIIIIVAVAIGVSMAFASDIELALGLRYYAPVERDSSGDGAIADGALHVHFVDVGQGDCTIIELPDGKTMIIDGGENNKDVENAIQKFIDDTLPNDFKYFDYAILTHPDSDHCGSLDYVLERYPARTVYRPNVEAIGTEKSPYLDPGKADLTANAVTKNTAAYAASVKAMYQTTDEFKSEVFITNPADPEQSIVGENSTYTFDFYSPLSDKYTGEGDWNNYSPIMILEYKGFKYAMSGDAEEKNLDEFVQKVNSAKTDGVTDKYDAFDSNYCVNVIKAGHHGSTNATTIDYLETLTTDAGASSVYCVISCGAGNKYDHPHKAALDRYARIGVPAANILRTDEAGDITLSVMDDGSGTFKMFYGSKVVETELVYKKLGNIELKWTLVGWIALAAVAVVLIIHIVLVLNGKGNGRRK